MCLEKQGKWPDRNKKLEKKMNQGKIPMIKRLEETGKTK